MLLAWPRDQGLSHGEGDGSADDPTSIHGSDDHWLCGQSISLSIQPEPRAVWHV